MEYLYANGVEHRDLKAANCLLDEGMRVKLADFGLARLKKAVKTDKDKADVAVGTPSHMAPEILLNNSNKDFSEKSDIYSFGIVMYEVLSGEVVWMISGEDLNRSQIITQLQAKRRPSPIPQDSPPELVTLMEKCWNDQRFFRPEFKKVVRELQDMAPSQQTSQVGSAGLSAAE